MNRPSRRFHPSLAALEKKELLSGVQVAHAAAARGAIEAVDQKFYNYINVRTVVNKVTDVTWELWGKRRLDGPNELLDLGRIGNLGTSPVEIASKYSSPSSSPAEFIFAYKLGYRTGRVSERGITWDRMGIPPIIPTVSIPAPRR